MKINLDKKNLDSYYVIGDVHGCYNTLINLINQLPKDSNLIFVGDLCDKGDFSKDVIEFVISNNHLCVKGNHEHLYEKYIIDAIENDTHSPWSDDKRYGGLQCINSYNKNKKLIYKHLKWIKQLPTYIEIEHYFITHGFALEYYKYKDNKDYYNDFLLNRIYKDTKEPKIEEDIINIFGHCIFEDVKKGDKYICLDTGCSNGGKLSAIQLGTNKIYQEPMDKKDSSYIVKELKLQDIDPNTFTIEKIKNITLKENCLYNEFDLISNEVLEYIFKTYPKDAKDIIYGMKDKSIIFPKQINKILDSK